MVRDYRYNKELNRGEWKIHWKDWPSDEDTWEPFKNLEGEYVKHKARKMKMKRKEEFKSRIEKEIMQMSSLTDSNRKQTNLSKDEEIKSKCESETEAKAEAKAKSNANAKAKVEAKVEAEMTNRPSKCRKTSSHKRTPKIATKKLTDIVDPSNEKAKVSKKIKKKSLKQSEQHNSLETPKSMTQGTTHLSELLVRKYLEANPAFLEKFYRAKKQKGHSRNSEQPLRILDTQKDEKRKAKNQVVLVEGKGKKVLTTAADNEITSSSTSSLSLAHKEQRNDDNRNCDGGQSTQIIQIHKAAVEQQPVATGGTSSSNKSETIEATTPSNLIETIENDKTTTETEDRDVEKKEKSTENQSETNNQRNTTLELNIKYFGKGKCKIEFC